VRLDGVPEQVTRTELRAERALVAGGGADPGNRFPVERVPFNEPVVAAQDDQAAGGLCDRLFQVRCEPAHHHSADQRHRFRYGRTARHVDDLPEGNANRHTNRDRFPNGTGDRQEFLRYGNAAGDVIRGLNVGDDDPDRKRVLEMLQAADWIDLIIPRGGAGLHQFCRDNSRIPVMTGGIGICHLFLDESADLEASLPLIENAKIQRPTVCNALDTLLIHRSVAQTFLPRLVNRLHENNVIFRADESALPFLDGLPGIAPAGPDDFDTEWLSLVLGLKVVEDIDEAIEHIQKHSTAHSDGILTQNQEHAHRFVSLVDSAAVYVNASTRFTDGSQLGLGAEVAISTQRLHARGPMALRELTTYKWVIEGDYQVRA